MVQKPLQTIQQLSQPQQQQQQPTPQIRAINELNELGRSLMEKSRNDPKISLNSVVSGMSDWQEKHQASQASKNLTLNELQQQNNKSYGLQLQTQQHQQTKSPLLERKENVVTEPSPDQLFTALNNLNVKLESIKPSTMPPLSLYDKNNLKIVLHFAKESPVQNVHIIVLSATSTNMVSALKNFSFQAAVPKSMKVKLQTASRSDLPVYNPILPPTAITQIMLIANPNPVSVKFDLAY
jgi:ADP-ribosylation factor-binding protein GGA